MEALKRISKKLIILTSLICILSTAIGTNYIFAAEDEDSTDRDEVTWYGFLAEPITLLVSGIGDAIINILQSVMLPGTPKAVKIKDLKVVTNIKYGPAAIFTNVVPMLDVNFINPTVKNPFLPVTVDLKEEGYNQKQRDKIQKAQDAQNSGQYAEAGNSAAILYNTISKWYVALRNLSILGLLVVLVYVGIRILISATADEKSNYKRMLKDWVMAIVLVVSIHYIILLLVTITQKIIEILGSSTGVFNVTDGDVIANTIRNTISEKDFFTIKRFGYSIVYFVIVLYTLTFTIRYIRRVIYLAFLTLISPMVALTYPLDKIKDGRSQAFNMWFKEFLFNLLIQPIHLLLYMVLVSAAMELAKTNMIYALVAIGFVLQAETFIKQMFGIKAEGGAAASGFAAGMMFSSALGMMQKGSAGLSKITGVGGGANKIRMAGGSGSSGGSSGGESSGGSGDLSALGGTKKSKGSSPSMAKDLKKSVTGVVGKTGAGRKILGKAGNVKNKVGAAKGKVSNKVNGAKTKITGAVSGSKVGQGYQRFKGTKAGEKLGNVGRGMGNVVDRFRSTNPGKKARNMVLKGYAGAAMGAMGVAAGLASDDFSNVLSYGALGVAGGMAIGNEIGNQADSIKEGAQEGWDTFKQGYYGDEYKQHEQEKQAKQLEHDPEMRTKMRNEFGADWKNYSQGIENYVNNGVTNKDDIIKGMKLQRDKGLNAEESSQVVSFANGLDKDDLTKNEANTRKKIENMGVTGADVDRVIDLAKEYKGIKI